MPLSNYHNNNNWYNFYNSGFDWKSLEHQKKRTQNQNAWVIFR